MRAYVRWILIAGSVALLAPDCQTASSAFGAPDSGTWTAPSRTDEAAVRDAAVAAGTSERDAEIMVALLRALPWAGQPGRFRDVLLAEGWGDAAGSERPLGFGQEQRAFAAFGDSAQCALTMTTLDRHPMTLVGWCTVDAALGEAALDALERTGDERWQIAMQWHDALAERDARVAAVLGELAPLTLSESMRARYEMLRTDPGVYGFACGVGGRTPDGREAFDDLLWLEDETVFRNLLRGPHPAGRLYGAEGLLRLHAFDAEDQRTLDAASDAPVPICDGCIPGTWTVAEAWAWASSRVAFDEQVARWPADLNELLTR